MGIRWKMHDTVCTYWPQTFPPISPGGVNWDDPLFSERGGLQEQAGTQPPIVMRLTVTNDVTSARIYKPSFREKKTQNAHFQSYRKRAFWAYFRENWVNKFGHRLESGIYFLIQPGWPLSYDVTALAFFYDVRNNAGRYFCYFVWWNETGLVYHESWR